MSGEVVGIIKPQPEGGQPLFEIVRGPKFAAPETQGCPHPAFVLNPEWATVTCRDCKEKLDPFSALMRYAEWWEHMNRRMDGIQGERKKLLCAELRRLQRRRKATDEHRATIDEVLNEAWKLKADELSARYNEIHDAIFTRTGAADEA